MISSGAWVVPRLSQLALICGDIFSSPLACRLNCVLVFQVIEVFHRRPYLTADRSCRLSQYRCYLVLIFLFCSGTLSVCTSTGNRARFSPVAGAYDTTILIVGTWTSSFSLEAVFSSTCWLLVIFRRCLVVWWRSVVVPFSHRDGIRYQPFIWWRCLVLLASDQIRFCSGSSLTPVAKNTILLGGRFPLCWLRLVSDAFLFSQRAWAGFISRLPTSKSSFRDIFPADCRAQRQVRTNLRSGL